MSTTKNDIASLALGLISRNSFSSFSYDDISRGLKVTKAAVHYHFKSKEDLGVAVCEKLRDRILDRREEELEAARNGRHPWLLSEARFKALPAGGICPIASLQADFENLPERVREALAELTGIEIESLCLLAEAYAPGVDADEVAGLLLEMKGALQYRRAMGEKFFQKAVRNVRKRFYEVMPRRD